MDNHDRHIPDKETRIYRRCLFSLPFLALAALLLHRGYSIPAIFLPPCMFHTLTGFSCPGCGCTRAVIALLHGDLLASVRYNPGILYCAVLYILFVCSHTAARLFSVMTKELPSRKGERSSFHLLNQIHGMKPRPVYLYILIGLLLGFGILRFFFELWQRFH